MRSPSSSARRRCGRICEPLLGIEARSVVDGAVGEGGRARRVLARRTGGSLGAHGRVRHVGAQRCRVLSLLTRGVGLLPAHCGVICTTGHLFPFLPPQSQPLFAVLQRNDTQVTATLIYFQHSHLFPLFPAFKWRSSCLCLPSLQSSVSVHCLRCQGRAPRCRCTPPMTTPMAHHRAPRR